MKKKTIRNNFTIKKMTDYPDNFEKSVKYLIETGTYLHNKIREPGSAEKYWYTCLQKFTSGFTKVQEKNKMRTIFDTFYKLHIKDLTDPLCRDDEDSVNDKWLKEMDYKPNLSDQIFVKSSSEFSRQKRWCRGYVIYTGKQEQLHSHSIPINEMYNDAVELWREKSDKDEESRSFPGRLLLGIYSVIYYSIDDEKDKSKILLNMNIVKNDILSDINYKTVSGGLGALGDMITVFAKTLGFENDVINNIVASEPLKKCQEVCTKVYEDIQNNNVKDPKGLMETLGKTFQDPEISKTVASVFNTGQKSLVTAPGNDENAGEQE